MVIATKYEAIAASIMVTVPDEKSPPYFDEKEYKVHAHIQCISTKPNTCTKIECIVDNRSIGQARMLIIANTICH